MFLTDYWLTFMGKTFTYADALSILAAVLIVLFLIYVGIKQRKNK